MKEDFNTIFSELNDTAENKLIITTAIVPVETNECCGCGGSCCGVNTDSIEVYVARIEMDDGKVRGVISHDSMEAALNKTFEQVQRDL